MHRRLKVLHKRATIRGRAHVRRIKKISRKPAVAIPAITFGVLGVVVAFGALILGGGRPTLNQTDTKIVIVSHDHQEQTVPTRAKTVGELLTKLGLTLNSGDVVEPSSPTAITDDNFRINLYRAAPVTIVDGSSRIVTFSAASTGRSIARQVGVQVYAEDRVDLLPTQNFANQFSLGTEVHIKRAKPVNVNLYGTFVAMRTQATTVGELLAEKHITMHEGDTVQPAASSPLKANDQVFVIRKGVQIQITEEAIAPPVQTIEDKNLTFGATAVRQQGVPGRKLVTYQFDTTTQQRNVIQEVVAAEPVAQINARGTHVDIPTDKTSIMAAAGITEGDFTYVNFVIGHESGWRPNALNAGGCAGLGQACPGSKLAAVCPNWQNDPVCQLRFFSGYAGRYGGWAGSYNFWINHGYW